ncbi:MAG: tRNA (adenosine(37)-N6)-threonylcarbamoyltransferase complex transferase subunit TsaD [Nitrospinaceae bacterium]|jgi:N6-L-threonylcarbamoyladenine synthase|nr:tRNA (adenosine(37)-N6)-threonylcarbamoyltransferase complex transferase subunit TsaD [Nitrospinaceae bacterium]
MLVLGIETSCDETAAAVLRDGTELLSSIVSDQIKIHSKYGGIVPELAGRSHIECIHPVIEQAIEGAGVTLKDIDLIAATMGPGLVASLLVGLNTAKGIAYALKTPLVGINHLEGHLLAIFLQEPVEFPFVALAVSGGHTDLYRVDGFGKYRILGRTRDDAAGESFDKVAKMLKLGYPGGPVIEAKARSGDPNSHRFPRALLENGSLDFSFSGLKTSVRNLLAKREVGERVDISDADISAGFQEAVIDVLVTKLMRACEQEELKRIVVTGGVAANGALRERVTLAGKERGMKTYFPKPVYCTDNAAMIACAGYYRCRDNPPAKENPLSLDASASLSLGS